MGVSTVPALVAALCLLPFVNGGRWTYVTVGYDYSTGYDFGHEPAGRTYIRGELKACQSMEVLILDNDDWSNYVFYQLYYYSSYTAMLDGGSYKTWDYGNILDCYNWKPFWFGWKGTTQYFGMGLEPFENVYLEHDFGRTVNMNILKVAAGESWVSGEWRWLIDTPPLFNRPSADGDEVLEISENTGQYSVIYTPQCTDEEGDTVTISTSDQHTDFFQIYYGYVYTMKRLDYETTKEYIVTYLATTDHATKKNSMRIKIKNEFDVTPAVTAHSIAFPEELPVDYILGGLFTTVDDEDDDTVTYSISGSHSEYIAVDSSTGELKVKKQMDCDTTNFDFSGLTFSATDKGGNTGSKAFSLSVYDINDNPPLFSQGMYEFNVNDGTTSGSTVGTIAVSDADSNNRGITTSILSQDGATNGFHFSISSNTIKATTTIDYESRYSNNALYTLVIQAVDNPSFGDTTSSTAAVRVKIQPVNEHSPVWSSYSSSVSVSEDAPELTLLMTVQATDSDKGEDGRITYYIDSVTDGGTDLFAIDSSSGELTVGGRLDSDSGTGGVGRYTVTIGARDNGPSPKSITATVTVSLTGTNDNAPIFDQQEYVVSWDEGATGSLVSTNIVDHDGDTVTLSIVSDNTAGLFSIDGHTVKVASALDYETQTRHSVVIRADDGVHKTESAVTINVNDIIDEDPVITILTSTSMAEEQTIGTRVSGGFVATDPDVSDTLTYAISGSGASYLSIDSTNGELTVSQNVDYESGLTQIRFTLTVTDTAGKTDSKTITITVDDINDQFPTFNPTWYAVNVNENAGSDVSLADLSCSDDDTGNGGTFDMSIAGGDSSGYFKMVGNVLKTQATPIDYEALVSLNYVLHILVQAVDKPDQGAANTGYATVQVVINPRNEFTPSWTAPSADGSGSFDVDESAPAGTVTTTFQASDDDHSEDGDVTYTITGVTAASGASSTSTFSVDASTGALVVSGPLDADSGTSGESSYTINVRASDSGSSPKHADATVTVNINNVNDNAPYYDQPFYSADIDEDAGTGDTAISLNVDDFDGDTVTLSILNGPTDLFEITGSDVKVKASLDFETSAVHVLTVRADDGVYTTDVSVRINLLDVIDEPPVITMETSATMAEEQAIGTGVYGGYDVTDPDAGDTLTYSIGGTDSAYVSIDSGTGELSIAQNVDREAGKTQLDLTLTVTDLAGLTATQTFSIAVEDINDKVPVFNPSEFTAEITENAATDISIVDLTCADDDLGDNAQFDVTVASGDGGAGIFKMSGLQLLTAASPADYESLQAAGFMYTLVITAVDKPQHGAANTGTAIVRVSVKPENEFTPVWTNSVDGSGFFAAESVSEDDPPGTVVQTYVATDDDLGEDGVVTYSVVSVTGVSGTAANDRFSIDSSTGALMIAGSLDEDSGTGGEASYTIVIRASDNGASPLSVEGSVVVSLTNVNDNAPTFDQSDYSADVSEASSVGSVVITLATQDYDGDSVTLSVLSGGDGLFQCDGNDVTIGSALDYETSTFHVLMIRASDGTFHTDVPLTVLVMDASDEVPVITMVTSATMSEEQAFGTGLYGGYLVSDADVDDVLTYSISGTDGGYVSINSSNGRLYIADHVDKEVKGQLDLTLTVTDGVLSQTQDFSIQVADINDQPSIFSPSEYDVQLTENTPTDTSIIDLSCSDLDTGVNADFEVSVASGDGGAGVFKMSGLQLQTSGTAADYESVAATGFMYTLIVTAVDKPAQGDPNTGTAVVRVTIAPVNEHSPVWTAPSADGSGTFNVDEDDPPGTTVTTFQASDDDEGVDGDVSYSIVSVTSDTTGATLSNVFTIDQTSGLLSVGGQLDSDLSIGGHASYSVVVRATDGGASPNSVEATVVVVPGTVNDNAPTFDKDHYVVSMSESSAVDDVVVSFVTDDVDGDTVTLSIHSGRSDIYEISGNDLKVKDVFDFETEIDHVVVVRVSDGVHEVDVSVNINILDEIDETPVITMLSSTSVAEEQVLGTAVDGGYVVTDADAGDTLSYALSGADSAYLSMDSATGALTVAQRMDGEAGVTSLSLTLTVTDLAGLQATQDFTITVEDINDQTPAFSSVTYNVDVTENTAADTSLLDLTCSDADAGNNAIFVMNVNHGDDASPKFKFVNNQLQTDATAIDYDGLEAAGFQYTLIVHAVDTPDQGDANVGAVVVIVTVLPVNEHSPTWTQPDASGAYTVSVDEDTVPGTLLTTLGASDDDKGQDGVITYSIVSVTGDSDSSSLPNLFTIDPVTGELKVSEVLDKDLSTGGQDSYTVVIRASDNGATPNTVDGTVVITPVNVNDNPVVFVEAEFQADVAEDSSVGSVAITMGTSDADSDAVTLTIVSGADDFFEIDGSDVKVKNTLDFESQEYYVLFVKATDGLHETEVSLRINITDVIDEVPVITMVTTTSMSEEQTIGTAVYGGYKVSDPDEQDVLTFALSGADASYLSVDSANGELTVAQNVDREEPKTSLTMTLTVTDQAGLQATQDFTITVEDINDQTPTFDPYLHVIDIQENTAGGTELVELTCLDSDVGNNAQFTVSLASGDDTVKKFKMEGMKLLTEVNNLDYETLESSNFEYTLFITAVDTPDYGMENTGTAIVRVTVKPENEYAPVWSSPDSSGTFSSTISEDTAPGSIMTTYVATDNDIGVHGDIRYSIVTTTGASGASADGLFAIDEMTGEFMVAQKPDYDTGTGGEDSYTIVIKASDGGTPAKETEGTVTVTLTNVNDNTPIFDQVNYHASVDENKPVGEVVITLTTEDHDFDTVTLSITSGDTSMFEVDDHDVKVKAELDFENKEFYVLIIKASDGVHEAEVPLHIDVNDVIDETPVISMVVTSSMSEGQTIGTGVVGGYIVTDADANDVLTYALSGADAGYLSIDSTTGELTVAQNVDREGADPKTSLSLTLAVTDQAGLQATQNFTITVEDINDQVPIFAQRYYEVEVDENIVEDAEVLDLTCSDGDSGTNADFTISINNGDDATQKFKMSNNKLVATSAPLDFESACMYVLTIVSVDQPSEGMANTGTTVVMVRVKSANDFTPVWMQPSNDGAGAFDGMTLDENRDLGTVITTFSASDSDLGTDGHVIYSLVSATGDTTSTDVISMFSMDSSTGELKVAKSLDTDLDTGGEASFTIVVRATDSGATPSTLDGTLVLTLTNINDNHPIFDQSEFTSDVNEDVSVGFDVIDIGTIDRDGDTVTISIMTGDTDLFEVDGSKIKVKAALDYETTREHLLFIKASDGTFETIVSLKVNIIDVIDEVPILTMVTTGSMSEGQIIGTAVVGGYKVTDADAQDELVYALSGADSHYLTINGSTGELTVAVNVDRDGASGVTELTDLTLTVTDQAGLQATQAFTITVVDINDITPTFGTAEHHVEITENTASGVSILTLVCSDGDEGSNADFDVSIGGGDDATPKFKVTNLQLETSTNPIDYESLESSGYKYTLYVIAVDKPSQGDPNTGTTVVIVTVKSENEFTPEWTGPSNDGAGTFVGESISEDAAPGTVITTFTATDDDSGPDGDVIYSIVSIIGDGDGNSYPNLFSIDASSGRFTVTGDLDRDVITGGQASYTLTLQAADDGATPNSVQGTIVLSLDNVNDNAPYFEQSEYQTEVDEDSSVGSTIISLVTEDPDGDAMTLTIESGGNDLFETTGNDIVVKKALDFETESFYVLVIGVTDGKHSVNVSLEITVKDVTDERPVITLVETPYMSEEQTVGTAVYGGYEVTDDDAGDTLTYSLSGTDSHYLTIDSSTGDLTVAETVDREGTNGKTQLTLTLDVSDQSGLTASRDFAINIKDINDLAPSCDPPTFSTTVEENSPADMVLLDLTCTDDDDGDNAEFNITIGSGDDTVPKFKMAGKQLVTTENPIDYEILSDTGFLFTLIITAVDQPTQGTPNTGTAIVKVKVTAINEFPPVWLDPVPDAQNYLPDVTVNEDDPPGTSITTVSASDDDLGDDGKIFFEISSIILDDGSDATGTFVIGEETGTLQVKTVLDAESSTFYDVSVRAVDGGDPAQDASLGVKVYVNNVNDLPPVFSQDKYQTEILEDTAIETSIFSFTASDEDGDTLTYAVDGEGGDVFECRDSDLYLLKELNFEVDRYHSIIVSVSDGIHTVYVSMIVNVADVSDEAPTIEANDVFTLPEQLLSGTPLGQVFTVQDSDMDDQLTFSLSGANADTFDNIRANADKFDIDASTGMMSIKSQIDGDSGLATLTDVTVTVTDRGGRSTSTDLSFNIKDVNDNVPQFSKLSHEVNVDEEGTGEVELVDFNVTDADAGVNGDVTLSILSGDNAGNPVFRMDGTKLYADTSKIDYDSLTSSDYKYTLGIGAVDSPTDGQALTGTTLVNVQVNSKNEFNPEWTHPVVNGTGYFPDITVKELTAFGTPVTNFTASDADAGLDGTLTYRIQAITDSHGNKTTNTFGMLTFAGRGVMMLTARLDADKDTGGVDFYIVTVTASDNNLLAPRTVTGSITIYIEDENDAVQMQEVAEIDAETWAMRGLLMALGGAFGVAGLVFAKSALSAKFAKPTSPPKAKMENHRGHDDEWTIQDLDDMYSESIVPSHEKQHWRFA